jgi:hypothetical protein
MMAREQQISIFRSITPFLVVIGASMILIGVLIYFWLKPKPEALGLELIKALVQVTTVLVLGQVVSTIVADRQHDRDVADRENELNRSKAAALTSLRVELLTRLSKTYTAVKRSRRLLRSRAMTVPWVQPPAQNTAVRREEYDEYMGDINDAELELESLWHQLRAASAELTEQATLVKLVKEMKNYLRDVLQQYELVRPTFEANTTLPISAFAMAGGKRATLFDFLSSDEHCGFQTQFVDSFHDAVYTLRKALLAGPH